MEDVKESNIVEDHGNFSNSLLSVINKNATNGTGNAAGSPKIPVIVVSDSEDTEDPMPKQHPKFKMRINNSNEALFVILPNSIICLICYKKFLHVSVLKGHILWHLHRNDVPGNNLCRSCKSNADISDCPSFKLIKKIMRNFLLSTIKKRQSLKNNSQSHGSDPNYNGMRITEDIFIIENPTAETPSNNSDLDNNNPLIPSTNTTNNNKPKDYQENSIQDDLIIETAVTAGQNKGAKFLGNSAVGDKSCVEAAIDSSEFMLVNGQYKCLSCSKDYTEDTVSDHVMWHFHKGVDLCSKLHYTSFSSGDTICPLVVQIINYLVSKEGKPIQVNWGKNNVGEIIFKVKLRKTAAELNTDAVVDNPPSLTKENNGPSSQSSDAAPPVAEYTIDEPLIQDHSDGSVTQNLTCNSEAGSRHPPGETLTNECSADTPAACDDKTGESSPLENDEQPQCEERTDVTTAGPSENNLHVRPVKNSDSPADAWSFYKCMVTGCNYSTLFPDNYSKHLKHLHGNLYFYQCPHCDFTADTYSLTVKHLKVHTHPTEFLFPCGSSECSYYTRVLNLLPKHFTSSHINCKKVLCKHCTTEFTDLNQLLEHYHCNLLKTVKCSYCPARDTLRQRILHHLSSSHPGRPRQIIVSSQLICSTKKQVFGHVKLLAESTVKVTKESLISEQEQTAGFTTNRLDDGNQSAPEKYLSGLINAKNHTKERSMIGDCSNEQAETNAYTNEQRNGLSDFKQVQEQKGVKMKQLREQKDQVKIKLKNSSKNISSSIEGFKPSDESNGHCEQMYNNISLGSNFMKFDIAGRELDACLKVCYEFMDQSLKCRLCFQTRKLTQEIHLHILQHHLRWYLWQCLKCKTTTYSLEEMHWHYQHNHQGWIICVKFLSLPQLVKGPDGKPCLQKEQKIVSAKSQESWRSLLYKQFRQQRLYEMVTSRKSKSGGKTADNKQRDQKLFIFVSDSQPLDKAEKIPDNDESTNNHTNGELEYEKSDKRKNSRKRSINDTKHAEVKKRKFSSLFNEKVEIENCNGHLKIEKDIKQDNNYKNDSDNNYNTNKLLINVEKHLIDAQTSIPLREAQKGECVLYLGKKTSSVNDSTPEHKQSILTSDIITSFANSSKMKVDPAVHSNKVKIGSPVDNDKTMIGSPVDNRKPKTGSPVDNRKPKTGSPVDNSKTKNGSPVDNSKTKTGSPVDNSKTKTNSPVDNSKTKTNSPAHNSKTKTNLPVHNNKTKIFPPVDKGRTKILSSVDNSKTKTGSSVGNSKTKICSPVDNGKTKAGSPVDNSKTKTGSPAESNKVKTGLAVEGSKVKIGLTVHHDKRRMNLPVETNKMKTGSTVDSNKLKTSLDTGISKETTNPKVEIPMLKTCLATEVTKVKTELAVDISMVEDGCDVEISEVKSSLDIGINKIKAHSDVFISRTKAEGGSDIWIREVKTKSDVETIRKLETSPAVGHRKVKSGSPVGISKMKTGLTVNTNKARTDPTISSKKVKIDSTVEATKVKNESNVNMFGNRKQTTDRNSYKRHLSNEIPSDQKIVKVKCGADRQDKKNGPNPNDCRRIKNAVCFDVSSKKDLSATNTPHRKTTSIKSKHPLQHVDSSVSLNKNQNVTNVRNSSKKTHNTTASYVVLSKVDSLSKRILSNADSSDIKSSSKANASSKKSSSEAGTNNKNTLFKSNMSTDKTLFIADASRKKTSSNANISNESVRNTTRIKNSLTNANASQKERADTTTTSFTGVVRQSVSASKKGSGAVRKSGRVAASSKKCKLCEFTSLKTFQLIRHMTVKHAKRYKDFVTEKEIKIIKDAIVKNSRNEYVCPFCKHYCSIRADCKLHIYHKHLHLKTLKCNQCMFFTRLPSQLEHHLSFHLK